jgi:hypothetical protein
MVTRVGGTQIRCNRHGSHNQVEWEPRWHWEYRVHTRELTPQQADSATNCELHPVRSGHDPERRFAGIRHYDGGEGYVYNTDSGTPWAAVLSHRHFYDICGPGWPCAGYEWHTTGHFSRRISSCSGDACIENPWHHMRAHCMDMRDIDDC